MFSEVVTKALLEGGWTPDRKVETTQYEEILKKEGYDVSSALKEFLTQFGGLVLRQPHYTEPTPEEYRKYKFESHEKLHFDVIDEIGIPSKVPMDKEDTYDSRVGDYLTPFGSAYNYHLQLLMTPTGKIYGEYGNYFTLLGNDYIEMFENIYHRVKTPEIK
jgi:hypothetical protein